MAPSDFHKKEGLPVCPIAAVMRNMLRPCSHSPCNLGLISQASPPAQSSNSMKWHGGPHAPLPLIMPVVLAWVAWQVRTKTITGLSLGQVWPHSKGTSAG